jgi:hypothetical protein
MREECLVLWSMFEDSTKCVRDMSIMNIRHKLVKSGSLAFLLRDFFLESDKKICNLY